MILKIIYSPKEDAPKETQFIDNFDKIETQDMRVDEAKKEGTWRDVLTSCYYDSEVSNPELHHVAKIMLFKEDKLFRILYLDNRHPIYLLNDEGKTIERINVL